MPASAYAESLVGPSRRGSDAIATVDAFLDAFPAAVEPASREIAREASGLRAAHGNALRLPDALVLATAQVIGAELVLTTDAGWPATSIEVTVLGLRGGRIRGVESSRRRSPRHGQPGPGARAP